MISYVFKGLFSGCVLSSQRSETTNRSLKRRLRATADLCDFYNVFCDYILSGEPKRIVKIISVPKIR